jgi:uncharacterized RDD family membrane protein YckC
MANPYAPPRAAVQDIVDATASASPAERSTRLGAALLDGLIVMGMVYAPLVVGFVLGSVLERGESSGGGLMILAGTALGLVGFVVWCWFTVRYVKQNGQSIGKKILGIKVIRKDGAPVTLGRLFWLRNLVNGLIGVIPFYAFIDHLFIFGDSRQCLHDKLADTLVVKA